MDVMPKPLNPVFADLPTTIFTVMSDLANEHRAINLGQGFPDTDGPEIVRRAAAEAILAGPNQYPQSRGTAELRRAVADHDRRCYGLELDWQREVIVTSGATEALAVCLFSLLRQGEEVIVLEPAYDSYAPVIRAAGGVPRFLPLQPPDWHIDEEALRAAFSDGTKAIIINTPMNPTGKVFTEPELSLLAELLQRFDAYAVCDEVYEHLVFDGHRHLPLMTLPGMRGHCLRVGSAGKTFALTGWKVGYITADKTLADTVARTHQFITFTTVPALQHAVAAGLNGDAGWFRAVAAELQAMRDLLAAGLKDIGFGILPCGGTYFLTVDFSRLDPGSGAEAFCRRMTVEAGVAAIPVSAFYHTGAPAVPDSLIRFCFCKRREVLEEALQHLRNYFS
jgi:N-succinyldiaminopimelate aminotransferase